MLNMTGKKSKTKQYVIGGVVGVIIICLWLSIPLTRNSSMGASVAPGNFFKSSTVDVSSLGSDIPQEGGAPGYALNGEVNDPAVGESMASMLFQSGLEDETAPVEASAAGSAMPPGPRSDMFASAGAPELSGPKGKLNVMPSMGGGGSNSATSGGAHNKFFGSGAAKTDFTPVAVDPSLKKTTAAEKRNALVAMLQKTEEKSAQAVRSLNSASAAGAAASAFEKTSKADTSNLNTETERGAATSGLALGSAAQDLKRNDPQLNKSKVAPPTPKAVKDPNSDDEEMKKMLMQMLMSSVIGPMFSTAFGAATPAK